jgi:threonine dehydratase
MQVADRAEATKLVALLVKNGYATLDLTDDEMAKNCTCATWSAATRRR